MISFIIAFYINKFESCLRYCKYVVVVQSDYMDLVVFEEGAGAASQIIECETITGLIVQEQRVC